MTIEYIITLGAGIVVPAIPILGSLFNMKRQNRPYSNLFIHNVPDIGEYVDFFARAGASTTVLKLIDIRSASQVRVVSNDFKKWNKGEKWFDFVEESLERGVRVTAYGNRVDSRVSSAIGELCSKGMKVGLVDEPFSEHCLTVDEPRQVWLEQYHAGHHAYNCSYTSTPHEGIWKGCEKYFCGLDALARDYAGNISTR